MEDQVTTKSVGVKYGLIYGIFSIGYALLLQITGLATEQWLGWLSFGFMIVVLVFAMKEFKAGNDGFMRLGQGIGLGMITIVISSLLSSIFTYVYVKFIDDSMISATLDKARQEMMKNPDLSDAQIEQAIAMSENFTTPEMIVVFALLGGLFFGFIISLVMSLIMKAEDPDAY